MGEVTDGRIIYKLKFSEMSIYTCFVILFILEKQSIYYRNFLLYFYCRASVGSIILSSNIPRPPEKKSTKYNVFFLRLYSFRFMNANFN